MSSKSLHPIVLGLLLSSFGFGCSGEPAPGPGEKSTPAAQATEKPAQESTTPEEPPKATAACRALVNLGGDGYHVVDLSIGEEIRVASAEGLILRSGDKSFALQVMSHKKTDKSSVGSTVRTWDDLWVASLPGGAPKILRKGEPELVLPDEFSSTTEFEMSSGFEVVGIFGPYLSLMASSGGYVGGAHDYDSSSYTTLRFPEEEEVSLDFLGPEALAAVKRKTAQADAARKKELGGDIGDALPIPENLKGFGLSLMSEEGKIGLALHTVLDCCSWAENHNMFFLEVPLEKAPSALESYLTLSGDPQTPIEAPDGCGAIGFSEGKLFAREGKDGEPKSVPLPAGLAPKHLLGVTFLKADDPFQLSWMPRFEEKETKPFSRLTPEEEKAIVMPHLAPGEKLAHAVFRGPFGPASDTILVVTESEEKGQKSFGGFALVQEPGGHRKVPLPAFGEWNSWEISAILLDNLDEDADREPILMASYMTGVGPEGAVPFYSNVVLDWNGSAFVRNPTLEKKIETLDSAAKIRKALEK